MTQTNTGQNNQHRPAATDTQRQSRDILKFIYRCADSLPDIAYLPHQKLTVVAAVTHQTEPIRHLRLHHIRPQTVVAALR